MADILQALSHMLNICEVSVQDPRTWDYFEDARASNDTWVALDNNAGFQGALAGLNQVSGTYDQCLQGYGIMARDKDICDTKLD